MQERLTRILYKVITSGRGEAHSKKDSAPVEDCRRLKAYQQARKFSDQFNIGEFFGFTEEQLDLFCLYFGKYSLQKDKLIGQMGDMLRSPQADSVSKQPAISWVLAMAERAQELNEKWAGQLEREAGIITEKMKERIRAEFEESKPAGDVSELVEQRLRVYGHPNLIMNAANILATVNADNQKKGDRILRSEIKNALGLVKMK
jgi:hypothetical protein